MHLSWLSVLVMEEFVNYILVGFDGNCRLHCEIVTVADSYVADDGATSFEKLCCQCCFVVSMTGHRF